MAETEGKNLKKEGEGASNDLNKSSVCGIHSVPGMQYRSSIVFTQCPHCKSTGPTEVESGWNIKNYLFCYYYGAYWKCLQVIRGKDLTLKDGLHKCSNCKKEIFNYQAC